MGIPKYPVYAQTVSLFGNQPSHVRVRLITEHTGLNVYRVGSETRIGAHFEMDPGWHIYAENPGDAGLPTQVRWKTTSHVVSIGPLAWPKHKTFRDPGDIETYGYDERVTLWSNVRLESQDVASSAIDLEAEIRWLACKEICIPGSETLSLTLPLLAEPELSEDAQLFSSRE